MFNNRFLIYLHTIRHLRLQQLYHLLVHRLMPLRLHRPQVQEIRVRPDTRLLPSLPGRTATCGEWAFNFINIEQSFPSGEVDWKSKDKPKLWRYNLHYFDYLRDDWRSRESRLWTIKHWIDNNLSGTSDAWEPFPVSLRVVNWIKLISSQEDRGSLKPFWLESLYSQMLCLENNVERHLLANHYFKNGKALMFGGLFFAGADAERWLRQGVHIIEHELEEQILPDGGHFERSPMYHAMILEDCLDLYNLCQSRQEPALKHLAQQLRSKSRHMVHFLLGMTHPDGEIALFNDAAIGIEAEPRKLASYFELLSGEKAEHPAGTAWSFQDSGYYVMAPEDGTRLVIDCGPIGPGYQPGHSHSDTLSFELTLKGRRVIVDSGCFEYMDGDVRNYNRGNAGHNTVTVDNQNQSEVWSAHRCARRANPLYGHLEQQRNGALYFEGAHDGYRRLPGRPIHHRAITMKNNLLLIEDRVEGGGRHDLESRLHIHPNLSVELEDGRALVRDGTELLVNITRHDGGRIVRTNGWYCPQFGLKQMCTVISYTCKNVPLPFKGGWTLQQGI